MKAILEFQCYIQYFLNSLSSGPHVLTDLARVRIRRKLKIYQSNRSFNGEITWGVKDKDQFLFASPKSTVCYIYLVDLVKGLPKDQLQLHC